LTTPLALPAGVKGVKVIFAHDTEVALAAAAALVNTGRGRTEQLPDTEALDRFTAAWGWTGERTHDQAELDAVRELRPRLARLWEASPDDAAGLVNTLLREAHALPQLVKHGGWDYAPRTTAATSTSTCPRTGPGGSAAPCARTGPTSPPTGRATPPRPGPGPASSGRPDRAVGCARDRPAGRWRRSSRR